jgi:hypothetical protein
MIRTTVKDETANTLLVHPFSRRTIVPHRRCDATQRILTYPENIRVRANSHRAQLHVLHLCTTRAAGAPMHDPEKATKTQLGRPWVVPGAPQRGRRRGIRQKKARSRSRRSWLIWSPWIDRHLAAELQAWSMILATPSSFASPRGGPIGCSPTGMPPLVNQIGRASAGRPVVALTSGSTCSMGANAADNTSHGDTSRFLSSRTTSWAWRRHKDGPVNGLSAPGRCPLVVSPSVNRHWQTMKLHRNNASLFMHSRENRVDPCWRDCDWAADPWPGFRQRSHSASARTRRSPRA